MLASSQFCNVRSQHAFSRPRFFTKPVQKCNSPANKVIGRKRCCSVNAWLPAAGAVSTIFTACTVAVIPLYASMIFYPKAKETRKILDSPYVYLAFAAVYCFVLQHALSEGLVDRLKAIFPTQFQPDLNALSQLFVDKSITLLCWINLLMMDLYMAREVFLDGLRRSIPTAHSVVLCFFFGPTGIISHAMTRSIFKRRLA